MIRRDVSSPRDPFVALGARRQPSTFCSWIQPSRWKGSGTWVGIMRAY